jgi:peptidoglycan hydrolase-like protein with peptidoglycan-binding domain
MALQLLRLGSIGSEVEKWQLFLIGEELLDDDADGRFGPKTEAATKKFQQRHDLDPDGKVGPKTLGKAIAEGLAIVEDRTDMGVNSINFPPRPDFPPLVSTAQRQAIFGAFKFRANPLPSNKENIEILGTWEADNIVKVSLPALNGVDTFGTPNPGAMRFHDKAKAQLEGMWKAWEAKGLKSRVLSFGGSFVPRFIRGSSSALSNHAFGSAFDINMAQNALGKTPARVGTKGSVRELVPIAHDFGFYWGGHFSNRADGMHFEVAKILTPAELSTLNSKYGI